MVAGVSKERIASAGHVAGVDLCPETFAIARAVALDIDWREGDVSHLPLCDGELGRRCRLPTGQACSGSRDAASVVKGGRSAVATSRADDEIPLMRELRRVAERRLPRSVGQDRLRGRERARCGTLRRWLAERDRAGAGSTGVRPVMALSSRTGADRERPKGIGYDPFGFLGADSAAPADPRPTIEVYQSPSPPRARSRPSCRPRQGRRFIPRASAGSAINSCGCAAAICGGAETGLARRSAWGAHPAPSGRRPTAPLCRRRRPCRRCRRCLAPAVGLILPEMPGARPVLHGRMVFGRAHPDRIVRQCAV